MGTDRNGFTLCSSTLSHPAALCSSARTQRATRPTRPGWPGGAVPPPGTAVSSTRPAVCAGSTLCLLLPQPIYARPGRLGEFPSPCLHTSPWWEGAGRGSRHSRCTLGSPASPISLQEAPLHLRVCPSIFLEKELLNTAACACLRKSIIKTRWLSCTFPSRTTGRSCTARLGPLAAPLSIK
jgi:hypothetical protein